ncbi:MAG: metalloregulator ArsR/SmtB family transcription factor [Candidatus Lokiarchaeota archaeon]|nr:metalloregulator ArsR/SmtB family transcription factor [Candidatus Lokiarchaeota archaeon]
MYEFLDEVVIFLKTLGDETRLNILYLLMKEHISAKKIEERLEKSQSTISQHLKSLIDAGLVEKIDSDNPEEKARIYKIKDDNIVKLIDSIKTFVISQKRAHLEKINDVNRLDTLL